LSYLFDMSSCCRTPRDWWELLLSQSVRATPGYSGGCAVAVQAANDVIVMAAATTITSFEASTATPHFSLCIAGLLCGKMLKQFQMSPQILPNVGQIFICMHGFWRICCCLFWATNGKIQFWRLVLKSVFCPYLIQFLSNLNDSELKKSAKFGGTRWY